MFVMWKIERIIILFFALMLAINLTIAGNAAAATFYVDDDGPADFVTIQAALDSASPGDEIIVYAGTYTENVDVNKTNITIRSESGNPFDIIVQAANSSDHVFNVTADRVKISGFSTIGASGTECAGIYLEEVEYCLIENNGLSKNDIGINLEDSSRNKISNNTALYNSGGIWLGSSSSNTLENNTVSSNIYSILLGFSSNSNTLSNNTASNNHEGIHLQDSSNNTLNNNTASNNIEFGIHLRDSSDNSIYNNYFNNTNNAYFEGTNTDNTWNTTKTAGSNIVAGPYLGGNFWANPDGTVYPKGVKDIDHDGIFDSQYNIEGSGFIDYLPLQEPGPGPKTITVNNNPSPVADFEFIQAAVNAAHDGDTILVYKSTYTENVDVDKTNITIRSESGNPFDTIVRAASSSDDVFNVKADGVKISGFSITGASDGRSGIYLDGAEYCLIEDNELSKNDIGIYLTGSSRNTLSNNTANSNNYCGIWLSSSSSNILSKNTASNNINNIRSLSSLNSNTFSENTESNNINYGIYLFSSSNSNMLENNIASNNEYGIYLDSSSSNMLNKNDVLDNSDGIFLDYSDENTLIGNTVNSNELGIYLNSSSNNCIYNNHFNNNNNAFFSGTNPGNTWNTAKTSGSNIIGGSYLGGNFWATPTKDGFSQTHKDKDGDGICDVTYNLGEGGIDYLPLLIHSPIPDDTGGSGFFVPLSESWEHLRKNVTENFTISLEYLKIGNSKPPAVNGSEGFSFKVSPPPGRLIYKNVTIQVGNNNFSSNESNFRNATIEFRVEKSWIEENNINESTIDLRRDLEVGKWDKLNTSKVDEGEDFISFVAETPVFSLFTISANDTSERIPRGIIWEYLRKNVTENLTISLEYLDTGYSNPPVIIVNESASSEFSAPPWEIVYKIVTIQVGEANFSSGESNFKNATIEFRVEKSWIEENDINEDKIYLKRHSEGKWNKLKTSEVREDTDYIYYEAETPGFSDFEIVASTFGKLVRNCAPAFLLIICLGKFFVSREKDQDEK